MEIKDCNKGDFVTLKDDRKGTVENVVKPSYIQVRMKDTNKVLAFDVSDVMEHRQLKPRVPQASIDSATEILHKSFRLRDTLGE
jgi:hypothetical protein